MAPIAREILPLHRRTRERENLPSFMRATCVMIAPLRRSRKSHRCASLPLAQRAVSVNPAQANALRFSHRKLPNSEQNLVWRRVIRTHRRRVAGKRARRRILATEWQYLHHCKSSQPRIPTRPQHDIPTLHHLCDAPDDFVAVNQRQFARHSPRPHQIRAATRTPPRARAWTQAGLGRILALGRSAPHE